MRILLAAGIIAFIIVAAGLFLPVLAGMTFSGINDAGIQGLVDLRTFLALIALMAMAALTVGALIKGKGG